MSDTIFVQTTEYQAYKDSGFSWIGDVPEHWDVTSLGVCLKAYSEKNRSDLPLLSITRELGVIERDIEDQESNHNFIPDDLSGYKVLKKGQFGMNKMKAWQGSYGVSQFTGIVSPAYFIFDFIKDIDPNFFNWAIRSKLYVSYFGSASDGVRVGQWDLSKTRMKSIPFLIPPREEQASIVRFLDSKAIQIDEAIAIKQKQMELLKERKQIIIQQAVTQGLNPDTPMKDSGVDWIGTIPEHWSLPKLKLISQFVNDGTHGSYPRVDEGYRLLSVRNIINNKFVFRDDDSRVSFKHFKEISSKFQVSVGDIQLAIVGATLGKVAVVDYLPEEIVTQRSVATIRVKKSKCLNEFVAYFMRSEAFQSYLWNNAGFSAQPGVYLNTIQNANIPLPSLDEQNLIVESIEQKSKSLDQALAIQLGQIEKLKEYKATLINSAVTGKIKVTELA